jgi:hypothetical protein
MKKMTYRAQSKTSDLYKLRHNQKNNLDNNNQSLKHPTKEIRKIKIKEILEKNHLLKNLIYQNLKKMTSKNMI